jgi:hypothetical protein
MTTICCPRSVHRVQGPSFGSFSIPAQEFSSHEVLLSLFGRLYSPTEGSLYTQYYIEVIKGFALHSSKLQSPLGWSMT